MVVIFAIIGKSEPLYEAEIVPAGPGEEELAYLHQFILHASLDMVQSAMWSNNAPLCFINRDSCAVRQHG